MGAYDETDDFGYAVVKDWPVMRLGETYLLRAEARFRQGNTQGAADDINVLRDRAFKDYRAVAPGAGKVTADQIDIDFILDERARELAFEEVRWFDIVRWKRADVFKKELHGLDITIADGFAEVSGNLKLNFPQPKVESVSRYWQDNLVLMVYECISF